MPPRQSERGMMGETIICGLDHLGNCPRCGYAITSVVETQTNADHGDVAVDEGHVTVHCVTGHTIHNANMVRRVDAPSPIYPSGRAT